MPLKVEFELEKPPDDGITSVEFCPAPASPFLLCSSWDCGLRLYDVQNNRQKAKIEHPVRPFCVLRRADDKLFFRSVCSFRLLLQ